MQYTELIPNQVKRKKKLNIKIKKVSKWLCIKFGLNYLVPNGGSHIQDRGDDKVKQAFLLGSKNFILFLYF